MEQEDFRKYAENLIKIENIAGESVSDL